MLHCENASTYRVIQDYIEVHKLLCEKVLLMTPTSEAKLAIVIVLSSGPLRILLLAGIYLGRTDREQIRSRINNNDCRTFRPRRPLSTAYKTKETAV